MMDRNCNYLRLTCNKTWNQSLNFLPMVLICKYYPVYNVVFIYVSYQVSSLVVLVILLNEVIINLTSNLLQLVI